MKFVRVRTYYPGTAKPTGIDQLYLGDNHARALARFRREYPEHDSCIAIAETYESDEHPEHFKACLRCGCVN